MNYGFSQKLFVISIETMGLVKSFFYLLFGRNFRHFQHYTPQIQVNNNSLGTTFSYAFFKKQLQSSVSLSYLLNRSQANVSNNKQFLVNAQVNYQHAKGFFVNVQETNVRIAAGKKF